MNDTAANVDAEAKTEETPIPGGPPPWIDEMEKLSKEFLETATKVTGGNGLAVAGLLVNMLVFVALQAGISHKLLGKRLTAMYFANMKRVEYRK